MTRSKIELGGVTPHNIKQLKRLNQVVFPVSYNDKFYKDVLHAGELAKLAYYNDIVVGAVCCRIDTSENSRRLYIMTLGCLYPYRRLGIGSKMVQHVLKYVHKKGNFDSIFLHVQVNNEGAIDFYKKFGFEIVETKEHYYKRIEPADAHVLQKTLRPKIAKIANGETKPSDEKKDDETKASDEKKDDETKPSDEKQDDESKPSDEKKDDESKPSDEKKDGETKPSDEKKDNEK